MRRSLLITLALLSCTLLPAQERSFLRVGIEWGYGTSPYKYWNKNYMDAEVGYRVWDESHESAFYPNAFAGLSLGADISDRLNLAAWTGIMGVYKHRRVMPLGMRLSFFSNGQKNSGMMYFLDGGAGFPDFFESPLLYFASLGSGYRVALSRIFDLDLTFRIRGCYDHPPLWDAEDQIYVEQSNIRKNIAIYGSAEFGIAFSF